MVRAVGTPAAIGRGWAARDVDPSEYVTDEWIAANTVPMKKPSIVRHVASRLALLATLQTGALTRDQMRRIVARTGLPAVEAWSSKNAGTMKGVWGALAHHTGTPWTILGDYPTLKVVRDGRPGLENSLSMFGFGRSATVYLISEKLSWHAGLGSWLALTDNGNDYLAGIEAESDGVLGHWTPAQVDGYPRLVASILVELGRGRDYTMRHADYAPDRKVDFAGWPGDGPKAFWKQVDYYLAHPAEININYWGAPAPQEDEENMALINVGPGETKLVPVPISLAGKQTVVRFACDEDGGGCNIRVAVGWDQNKWAPLPGMGLVDGYTGWIVNGTDNPFTLPANNKVLAITHNAGARKPLGVLVERV